MASPLGAMGSALYSHLAAGTALTTLLGGTAVWNTLAPPDNNSLPYVVFFYSGGGDDNDSPRRARSPIYTVKAVAATKLAAANLDAEIDALLHEQTITVTGYTNYWTARVTDIDYAEENGGVLYWHSGGQYRIRIAE